MSTATITATRTDIEITHQGKSYQLWRRGDNLYLRIMRDRRQIWKSLKSSNKAVAIATAKKYLDEQSRTGWAPEVVAASPARLATLGEILSRFEDPKNISRLLISERSVAQYASALKTLVSTGTGKEYIPSISSSILTEKLVRDFIARSREAKRPDHSINSHLTTARCVLSEKFSEIYDGLTLPDLKGFRLKKNFKGNKSEGFRDFGRQTVIDMESAAEALWQVREPVWVVYAMMSQLGLRNGEVERAKWSDFEERTIFNANGESSTIRTFRVVAQYEEAIEGEIEVSDELWQKLSAYKKDDSEFVVPGKNKTERAIYCERMINRFVERFIPDRQKKSYELRKWAGSIVATRHGIYAAQRFLRHRSVTTTERYYATYLSRNRAATSSDRQQIYGLARVA